MRGTAHIPEGAGTLGLQIGLQSRALESSAWSNRDPARAADHSTKNPVGIAPAPASHSQFFPIFRNILDFNFKSWMSPLQAGILYIFIRGGYFR